MRLINPLLPIAISILLLLMGILLGMSQYTVASSLTWLAGFVAGLVGLSISVRNERLIKSREES